MAKRKRKHRPGLSLAEEARLKGKLRGGACSEAWLDAEFFELVDTDAASEPVSIRARDPQRSSPAFDPRTGRVCDDGGRCRRVPCRCCGIPMPVSGFAGSTLQVESLCPRCGSRWPGEHLSCHRCGQILSPADRVQTCLCRDCGISGRPLEEEARDAKSYGLARALLRQARRIREAQDAYGVSPWRIFRQMVENWELRLPWD